MPVHLMVRCLFLTCGSYNGALLLCLAALEQRWLNCGDIPVIAAPGLAPIFVHLGERTCVAAWQPAVETCLSVCLGVLTNAARAAGTKITQTNLLFIMLRWELKGPEVGVVSLIVNNVDVSNGRRVNQCILLTSCRYIHVYMIPPKHCRLIKKTSACTVNWCRLKGAQQNQCCRCARQIRFIAIHAE